MSKNTPGPWAVSGGMDGRQGRVIEAYATDGNPIRHLVASAARLIAAAPDLLAACESALPCLENEVAADCPWCNGEGGWTQVRGRPPQMTAIQHKADCPIVLIKAALSKAQGD